MAAPQTHIGEDQLCAKAKTAGKAMKAMAANSKSIGANRCQICFIDPVRRPNQGVITDQIAAQF